jgi:chorismate synthase
VAAGAVAQQLLSIEGIDVVSFTRALGNVRAEDGDMANIERNRLFCPDMKAAEMMEEVVREARAAGDSLGGIVETVATGVPAGLGDPVFDKLDGDLAGALMSIGAVKGVEIGSGFRAADMRGSENNDEISPEGFLSNNAGGILAGISNGEPVVVRVAVKPIPSISREQQSINIKGEPVRLRIGGRHDASAIPRIVPVCQAMVRLVLAEHLLRFRAISGWNNGI